ncbi:hypothetical protein Tco_1003343 [Tanacetum coccineum]|uniref:Secreted protein n=1 Tax=Tanacetum coccineum TaxID=301880 RepID=A0ABQ5F969_9ASTR
MEGRVGGVMWLYLFVMIGKHEVLAESPKLHGYVWESGYKTDVGCLIAGIFARVNASKGPNKELMPLDVSCSKGLDVKGDFGQTYVRSKGTITEETVNQTVVARVWPSLVMASRVYYRDLGS